MPQENKLEPLAVNYRPASMDDMRCAACSNFDGLSSCAKVAGTIRPDAICDLFTPMGAETELPPEARDALEREMFGNG